MFCLTVTDPVVGTNPFVPSSASNLSNPCSKQARYTAKLPPLAKDCKVALHVCSEMDDDMGAVDPDSISVMLTGKSAKNGQTTDKMYNARNKNDLDAQHRLLPKKRRVGGDRDIAGGAKVQTGKEQEDSGRGPNNTVCIRSQGMPASTPLVASDGHSTTAVGAPKSFLGQWAGVPSVGASTASTTASTTSSSNRARAAGCTNPSAIEKARATKLPARGNNQQDRKLKETTQKKPDIIPDSSSLASNCVADSSCKALFSFAPSASIGTFSLLDSGYILTPGRHRIHINSFLMQVDADAQHDCAKVQPNHAAYAVYAQSTYLKWREMEELVDKRCYQLAFDQGTDIERFRRLAIHCIMEYVRDFRFSTPSIHCAINNIHRVLLWYIHNIRTRLSTSLFASTVAACLRMALKHEETPEKTRILRESPGNIWQAAGIRDDLHVDRGIQNLNKVESECFNILTNPLTPPSGPDYIDRYLSVGGWPEALQKKYREISLYFLALIVFSRKDIDNLSGIPPSLLAAGALALGVKIISADSPNENYEFWPERLAAYTKYSTSDLRTSVKGISLLLRNKPAEAAILEHFHPKWACYDWK